MTGGCLSFRQDSSRTGVSLAQGRQPTRFTTNAYPKEQRNQAWSFALQRLSLRKNPNATDEAGNFYGELVSFKSPAGIEFTRVVSTREQLIIDLSEQGDLVWLAVLLEGKLSVTGTAILLASCAIARL